MFARGGGRSTIGGGGCGGGQLGHLGLIRGRGSSIRSGSSIDLGDEQLVRGALGGAPTPRHHHDGHDHQHRGQHRGANSPPAPAIGQHPVSETADHGAPVLAGGWRGIEAPTTPASAGQRSTTAFLIAV